MPKFQIKKTFLFLVFSLLSFSVTASPTYIVNTHNKKVIKTPHYYEFDFNENSSENWWCGHTALKSAMASFGVYRKLGEIHNSFISINKENSKYDYNTKGSCKYCAHIKLMEAYINSLNKRGVRIKASYKVSYSASSYFKDMKKAIDEGKVAVSLSKSFYSEKEERWLQIGHYLTIHGYREENGKKFLYLRDPIKKKGGEHTDWHEIPLESLWNIMNKNNSIQSIIISDWIFVIIYFLS